MPDSEVAESEHPANEAASRAPASRRSRRTTRSVFILAIIAGVLTTFDGVATWYEVEVMRVAEEANPFLQAVEGALGFTGAMIFRILVGLALLAGVWIAARRSRERAKALFIAGLFLACVFYALLDTYHLMIFLSFSHMTR